jgi:hypothetical protein
MATRDRLWKHLGIAFVAALTLYLAGFFWMEHRRSRLGPWEVSFIQEPGLGPRLEINQHALQITNVQLEFAADRQVSPTNATVEFTAGRTVPFTVPFGECVFMDPLFLPGTVTLELFDHQIELLPRSLIVDGEDQEWTTASPITIAD